MANSTNPQTSLQELLEIQLGIAQAISEVPDPLAILDHMLDNLKAIHGVDAVGVYFQSGEDGKFVLGANWGLDSDAHTQIAVVKESSWAHLENKLLGRGLQQIISLPITTIGVTVGYLVAASSTSSGLTKPIRTALKTVAANLSGMVVHSQTEAALRNSRHNLATVFEKFDDLFFVVAETGMIVECNTCNLSDFGFEYDQIVNSPIIGILPGSKSLFDKNNLKKSSVQEGKLLGEDNRQVPVEIHVSAGHWEGNDVWYVTCRDVRERRDMERERNRLAKAIDQTTESIVITKACGAIIYTNPAFSKLTGYTKEEILGKNPRILKSGQQSAAYYSQLWATITSGQTWSGRLENCRKDGTVFIEEGSISPMRDETGSITHFVGVKRDVSLEVDLELKLRDSQKMEAIGTLAGGIAHDFNNILYALLGYGQLALDDIPEDHPARLPVQEICKAGERATDLVDKMLTFGRRADAGQEIISLKPVVEEALGLARASLPATIEFKINLQDECSPVLANQTQIHQVVLNLCTNAEYALRNTGGILKVTLEELQMPSQEHANFPDLPAGNWMCLEIADTGVGMNKAVVDRIFEPYFTTKKAHEGTGLGLATAHGIINSHQGHIFVNSSPGQGSTFTIFLPVSSEDVVVDVEKKETPGKKVVENSSGLGNIMIIDDEQMIVDIMCKTLPRMGYEVAGFTEGIKALEVFRVSPSAFDLVITDQTMPQITGFEVAAELLSIRPDLPIILTTGYADMATKENARMSGIKKFLPKPLKISELSEIVADLLGETVPS